MQQEFVTKGELAYRLVRQRILSGEIAPGTVINQADLAARIGMSTTPLREALNRLQANGLVYTDAYKDTRVVSLTAAEALHINEVRLELDPLAARLAAERRTDEEVAQLRVAAERLGPALVGSLDESIAAHYEFHRRLYLASKNDILISMLDSIWALSDRYRRFGDAVLPKRTAEQRHLEHIELMDLVIARKAGQVAVAMREHVNNSLATMASVVLPDGSDAEPTP